MTLNGLKTCSNSWPWCHIRLTWWCTMHCDWLRKIHRTSKHWEKLPVLQRLYQGLYVAVEVYNYLTHLDTNTTSRRMKPPYNAYTKRPPLTLTILTYKGNIFSHYSCRPFLMGMRGMRLGAHFSVHIVFTNFRSGVVWVGWHSALPSALPVERLSKVSLTSSSSCLRWLRMPHATASPNLGWKDMWSFPMKLLGALQRRFGDTVDSWAARIWGEYVLGP